MNKSIILGFAASLLMLSACNDFLEKNPRDTFINDPSFWSNTNDVQSYTNKFYDNYVGYSQAGGLGWFYFKSLSDDQIYSSFSNWDFITVPNTSSYWNNGFTEVRRANYVIQNVAKSSMDAANMKKYIGIARLNRAWSYYQLVREYGDVEWRNEVVTDPDDANIIYKERTDRDVVMDSVLADLDYAIANIGSSSDKTAWSSDMARAMKSDICLYEGTFCKYRTQADNGKAPDNTRAQKYLNECVKASEALMQSGKYQLTANYGEIYNSLDLTSNPEIIFMRNYEKDVVMHGLCDYTCGSTEIRGITKDLFDAFLFRDGKAKANTSLDTDDNVTVNKDGDYSISKPLSVRDKRLSVLTDSIVFFKGKGWCRPNTHKYTVEMTSSTGYGVAKYDNTTLETYYRTNTNTNYTDAPLYWYAVILLNEAEAKAELGTITQEDLNKTINLLQKRASLPDMTLNPQADPANNMGVSNLIWEIRRCRRCELALDNWYRYWDLVRWHQLDKLDMQKYPNINRGANLSKISASDKTNVSLDANGYMIGNTKERIYNAKYYLYPIPSAQIQLNEQKLHQNPGW